MYWDVHVSQILELSTEQVTQLDTEQLKQDPLEVGLVEKGAWHVLHDPSVLQVSQGEAHTEH